MKEISRSPYSESPEDLCEDCLEIPASEHVYIVHPEYEDVSLILCKSCADAYIADFNKNEQGVCMNDVKIVEVLPGQEPVIKNILSVIKEE